MKHAFARWINPQPPATATAPPLPAMWRWRYTPLGSAALLSAMLVVLTAFYRPKGIAPLVGIAPEAAFTLPLALGLLGLFGLLALLRPDLSLLFVALTLPLTYRSRGFWDGDFGISDKYFPLHELVLWITLGATLCWVGVQALRRRRWRWPQWREWWLPLAWLLVGLLGVSIATPEGRAAAGREWRWMFLEPLVLYWLVRYWGRWSHVRWGLVAALIASGVAVALVGLLQRRGIDLTPLDGTGQCYSDFVVNSGGVERTSSVFCHPNNLALWLDRCWPLALALLAGALLRQRERVSARGWLDRRWAAWVWAAALSITMISTVLTYSKGARFAGAIVLIGLSLLPRRWWFTVLTTLVLAAALAYSSFNGPERLNITGASSFARLSLWRSGARMLADHPLTGIGLDQFYFYYNPEFNRGYIEPSVREEEKTTAHPHNIILDLLLRVGPLGFAIFWLLIGRTLWRGWRGWLQPSTERWISLGVIAALGVGLLHGLVDQGYFSTEAASVTWIFVGLIDALWQQHSDQRAMDMAD